MKAKTRARRIIVTFVAMIVLTIIVLLPFTLKDVLADILEQTNPVFYISDPSMSIPEQHTKLNLDIVSVNEWEGTIKINASAYDSCTKNCDWQNKILLVSVVENHNDPGIVSPSKAITFSSSERDVSQVIELPIFGDPIRYPFDEYRIRLGIILERVYLDGKVVRFEPEEAQKQFLVTAQSRIPRLVMEKPVIIEGLTSHIYGDLFEKYQYTASLNFSRPVYMKILTVLLVVLITAASAYAVFMGPLSDLLINSGALVLGVWGIRAILLGSEQPGITAADLVLSLIVLFLLVAIAVRGLNILGSLKEIPLLSKLLGKHHKNT